MRIEILYTLTFPQLVFFNYSLIDEIIATFRMWDHAIAAVLYAIDQGFIALAIFKKIEGTIAEETIEGFQISVVVAGKVNTGLVLYESIALLNHVESP